MKLIIAIAAISLSVSSFYTFAAPYTQDTGKIKTLFVSASGAVAITLDTGYPNAKSGGQCATAGDFAGVSSVDPVLKSALIAAKAAQQPITVTISGCEPSSGNGWYKIGDVYIN